MENIKLSDKLEMLNQIIPSYIFFFFIIFLVSSNWATKCRYSNENWKQLSLQQGTDRVGFRITKPIRSKPPAKEPAQKPSETKKKKIRILALTFRHLQTTIAFAGAQPQSPADQLDIKNYSNFALIWWRLLLGFKAQS